MRSRRSRISALPNGCAIRSRARRRLPAAACSSPARPASSAATWCARCASAATPVWVWTRDADRALARFGPHVHVVTKLADIPAGARIDAVVNLAGAPVIGLPWTQARRQLLIDSRVKTTQAVLDWCRDARPAAARAGERQRDRILWTRRTMNGSPKTLRPTAAFQSRLCVEREAAANAAEAQGIRAVNLRIGLVLGNDGGIFPQLAPPGEVRPGREDRRRPAVDVLDSHRRPAAHHRTGHRRAEPARRDQRRGARARTPGRFSARAGAQPAPAVLHAHPRRGACASRSARWRSCWSRASAWRRGAC